MCVSLCFPRIDFASLFQQKLLIFSFFFNVGCIWNLKPKKKKGSYTFSTVRLLFFRTPLMVDFAFIRQEAPSISFFFSRLGVFLEFSGGHHPQVGFFLPWDCEAFRPVLTTLYPLLRHSLIAHHLEMTAVEYRDIDVRSSKPETGLSSSGESMDKDFEIVVSKPSSSSNPPLLHLQSLSMLSMNLALWSRYT